MRKLEDRLTHLRKKAKKVTKQASNENFPSPGSPTSPTSPLSPGGSKAAPFVKVPVKVMLEAERCRTEVTELREKLRIVEADAIAAR